MAEESLLLSRRKLLQGSGFVFADFLLNTPTTETLLRVIEPSKPGNLSRIPDFQTKTGSSKDLSNRQLDGQKINCKPGEIAWDLPSAFGAVAALSAEVCLLPSVCDWDRNPEPGYETATRYGIVMTTAEKDFG